MHLIGVRKIPWRRKWQPTPQFLPGESHGRRSLVGYSSRVAKSRTRLSDFTSLSLICKNTFVLNYVDLSWVRMSCLFVHLFILAKTMLYKHRLQVCHNPRAIDFRMSPLMALFHQVVSGRQVFGSLHVHVIFDYSQVCGAVEKLQAEISLVSD